MRYVHLQRLPETVTILAVEVMLRLRREQEGARSEPFAARLMGLLLSIALQLGSSS